MIYKKEKVKKTVLLLVGIIICAVGLCQEPVHWNYTCEKKKGEVFELHLTATINSTWHIYAQKQPKDAIAIPTQITFNKNPLVMLTGKPKEVGKLEKQKVEVLDIEQNMYEKTVDFVQWVLVKGNVKTSISGTITYQVCTEEKCLPPKTITFSIPVSD